MAKSRTLAVGGLSVLTLLVAAVAGCNTGQDSPSSGTAGSTEMIQPVAPRSPGAAVTLREVDETELASTIETCRGKVVLVDYWATWCTSCVKLFPHTVSLSEELKGKGLVVISVSLDDPDSRAAVLAFLKKRDATFDNFISRYGAGVESFEKFRLPGMLPQLQLYDREGNLVHTFPDPQKAVDEKAIDEAVRKLLEEN